MSAGPGLRILPALSALAVAGALAAGGWYGYRELAARPIARVEFEGDIARIAPADLEAFARTLRGVPAGSVSLAAVRAAARSIPWVRDASVRRRFPDGLDVSLEAYDALARWGADALVSSRGEVFRAPYTGALPRFQGPEGSAAAMAEEYPVIAKTLAPLASPVAEVHLSERGAWQVVLASGLVLELGRGDIAPRLARFAAAWPGLAARGVETRHADLRYANGFAIRRVADARPAAGPAPAKAAPSEKPHPKPTAKKKK
ncbi:MAG TPA: cell division protein FtsQ/DivIB [Usitatibacter sp.]|nr:cell division protein FtsQ/DivIB [Usitatibacter sp.]